jgi:RimJ/RimL family protein N-acetyltransferase
MPAPTLHTSRLTLRPHVLTDMDPFWEFHQSARAQYINTPDSWIDQWFGLAAEIGTWDLLGHGGWALDLHDGTFIGQVIITQPPYYPERELGWTLFEGHEGNGYATEAVTTAILWAGLNGFETLVSYIHPDNARSIALASRLGAVFDPDAPLPEGCTSTDTVVYRHTSNSEVSPEASA